MANEDRVVDSFQRRSESVYLLQAGVEAHRLVHISSADLPQGEVSGGAA